MISVASFGSLPEGETVPTFATSPASRSDRGETAAGDTSIASDAIISSRTSLDDSSYDGALLSNTTAAAAAAAAARMPPPQTVPQHTQQAPASEARSTTHFAGSPPKSPTSHFPGSKRTTLKRALTEPSGANLVAIEEKMRKRGLVARELLETERAFVESLRILHDSFYQPLLARCGGRKGSPEPPSEQPILSRKAIAEIFSNFVDILQLNTELLDQLEERMGGSIPKAVPQPLSPSKQQGVSSAPFPSSASGATWKPETDTIGDILVPIAPFLKMYSLYVKNFSSALARIESERRDNEAFDTFLRDTERSTWGKGKAFFGLGLQAHLLTVVQRIPRYTLLVRELLKTTPFGHPDYQDLRRALEMIEQVANSINENVRQHEMALLILSLQRSLVGLTSPLVVPGRSLLKRGTLLKAGRKDIQPRAFFLFTDCILYARAANGGGAASIEAAWNAIARVGGGSSNAGLAGDIAGPWTTANAHKEAAVQPISATAAAKLAIDLEGLDCRSRVSSGNLFSSHTILDALQTAAASSQSQPLQFRDKFALQDCTVIGIEEGASHAHPHASTSEVDDEGTPWSFEIRTPDKSFAVYAESQSSRDSWVNSIREARNDWLQGRRTLRAEEDSIEAKRDRRRSMTAAAAKARHSLYMMAPAAIPEGQEVEEGNGQSGPNAFLAVQSPASGNVSAVSSALDLPASSSSSSPKLVPVSLPALGARTSLSLASLPSSTSFAALLGATGGAGSASSCAANSNLRVLEDYNAPAWVPDSRADRCMSCSESFGIWRRKHHCRLCGRVVCWSCSTRKFVIASYEEGKEDTVARACDPCYESTFAPQSPEELVNSGDNTYSGAGERSLDDTVEGDSLGDVDRRSSFASSSRPHALAESPDTTPASPCTPHDGECLRCSDDTLTRRTDGRSSTPIASSDLPTEHDADKENHFVTPKQHVTLGSGTPQTPTAAQVRAASAKLDEATSASPLRFPLQVRQYASRSGAGRSAARSMIAASLLSNPESNVLSPTVQAATSGTGTFRLAPPRVTTPDEAETASSAPSTSNSNATSSASLFSPPACAPSEERSNADSLQASETVRRQHPWHPYGAGRANASTSHRSLIGRGDSYFGGVVIHEATDDSGNDEEDGGSSEVANHRRNAGQALEGRSIVKKTSRGLLLRRRERVQSYQGPPRSNNESSSSLASSSSPPPPKSKRKPLLSAAARLSAFYGKHQHALGLSGGSGSMSRSSTSASINSMAAKGGSGDQSKGVK